MPDTYAALAEKVVQYDGTNSAEILAAMNDAYFSIETTLTGDVGGVLTLLAVTFGGPYQGGGEFEFVVQSGDWVRPRGPEIIPAATFAERWIVKP